MPRSIFSRLRRRFGTPSSGAERREQIHTLWTDIADRGENDKVEFSSEGGKPHVLIVGAGFAGLCAGHYLAGQGWQVTVLEARDRVGGRVHSLTDFACGQTIEGGAELIGTNHQLWMKLAIQFGLSFDAVTSDDLFNGAGLHEPFIINGKDIDSHEAELLHDWMDKVTDELTTLSHTVNSRFPWLSVNARELDNTPLSVWLDAAVKRRHLDDDYARLLRTALELEFATNNAVPTTRQSLLGFLAMIKGGGGKKYWDMSEVFRCSMGNDALATALEKSIVDHGGMVFLNSAVKSIDIEPSGVVVAASKGSAEQVYKGDAVILAVPPSVWGNIRMDPKIIAGMASQMGVAVKYLSALDNRFWVNKSLAPSGSNDQIGMIWEGSDNQSCGQGKEIELTVFAGSDNASALANMSETERNAFYGKILDQSFQNLFTPNQVRSRFMSWPTEPWTMAGYSFPNVGEVCTKIKALNEVYNKRMLFAGEHTCLAFVGYMEGALQSGRNAAMALCPTTN
jgi:monoamine oxidase